MAQYIDIIIPSGSTFNNAVIKGFGNVAIQDIPRNQFDIGVRSVPNGSYRILSVVDRSNEDTAPFAQPMNISGFSVKIGTVVNIQLTKNVTALIPNELIIFDGEPSQSLPVAPSASIFSKIPTGLKIIGALAGVALVIVAVKAFK